MVGASRSKRTSRPPRKPTNRERASAHLEAAIAQMRHFDKIRVPYFQMLMARARHHKPSPADATREIVRLPGNPMRRYVRGAGAAVDPVPPQQETLMP